MEIALKDLVIIQICLIPGEESTEEVRAFPLEKNPAFPSKDILVLLKVTH